MPQPIEAPSLTLYEIVLKQTVPLRYSLGVIYTPMEPDLQGDFAKAATIQQAAWGFMRRLQDGRTLTKWAATLLEAVVKAIREPASIRLDVTGMVEEITKAQRRLGDQHQVWDEGLGEVVECYLMPCDGTIGDEVVKEGTWLLGVIWSPEYFAKIQAGERTGYSMGGKARRVWMESLGQAYD
jgi:hypothetical protein